jgi:hypothetical protein
MDARGTPQRRKIVGRAARGTGGLRKTLRHWAISGVRPDTDLPAKQATSESASEAPMVILPIGSGNSTVNLRPATACLDCDGVRSEIG